MLAVLVTIGVAGCADQSPGPAPSSTPAPVTSSAAPSPAASLTADGTFSVPIICRAIVDYQTVQAAIATGKLATIHKVAALAATDAAAGYASDRAHTWAPDVQPLLPAYFTKGDEQVAYFKAVATARTAAAAEALQWPDGTSESTPVFSAIGISGSLTCPKP